VAQGERPVPQGALKPDLKTPGLHQFPRGYPSAGQPAPPGRTSEKFPDRRFCGNMPEVSVIIATYNRGPLLEEALNSVLSQTYTDYEVIVVDDGSTDDTPQRLLKYGERLKVLSLEHTGKPSVARNAAAATASGNLLAFLDSDDIWMPTKLEQQVAFLHSNPSFVMCYCDATFLSEDGRLLGRQSHRERLRSGWVLRYLLLGNFVPFSTVMVQKKVVEEVRGFEEWLTICEDWHLLLKISSKGEVGLLREPLCQIRVHPQGMTSDKIFLFEEAIRAIEDLARTLPEASEKYASYVRRGRARMLSMLGRNYLFRGDTAEARRLFWKALADSPLRLDTMPFLALACLGRRPVLALRSLKKALC
jgi:glycosyltransferase involved in cell wall biosynthesis